jgi:hypothetical protein
MTTQDYWTNLATMLNVNNIDPLNRSTLLPLEIHDSEFGIAYHVDVVDDSIDGHWDVINAPQSQLA